MITPSTVITEMTVAQARHAVAGTLSRVWANGGLPHESLDSLNGLADSLLEALVSVSREDDLDLRSGPLETISEALELPYGEQAPAAEMAVTVFEALIDAGYLPGVNAQKVTEPDV